MGSSMLACLVLVGVQLATAQQTRPLNIDKTSVSDTVREFMSEVVANMQHDVAVWKDHAAETVQDIRNQFTNSEENRRRLLSASTSTIGSFGTLPSDMMATSWQLILNAGGSVRSVIDAGRIRIQDFFTDMIGRDWSTFSPKAWLSERLSWETISNFDIDTNIDEYYQDESVQGVRIPRTIKEFAQKIDAAREAFCTPDEICPPTKVNTKCEGTKIVIIYEPKTCMLQPEDKQIFCDPAKLLLKKVPAHCTLKHNKAFKWQAKECKAYVKFGAPKEKLIGGEEYTVDMTSKISDAVGRIKPGPPLAAAHTTVAGKPYQLLVMWSPPENAATAKIMKYVVTCTDENETKENTRIARVLHTKNRVTMGVHPFGENKPLAPGHSYTCSVVAVNHMGMGPPTATEIYLTPPEVPVT